MFKVDCLKEFTSGTLKGMTFEDTVSFPTLESAIEFTNTKEVKKAFGGSDYKIIWTNITKVGGIMLTPQQERFLELSEKYEELKKQMKELKPELNKLLADIGIGSYFQDPSTGLVYKIVQPTGTYIEFSLISYDRTKKEDEKRGSLSKKEAQEAGFEL